MEQSFAANVKNHNVYALCSLLLVCQQYRPVIFLPKFFAAPLGASRSSGAPVHWTAWTPGIYTTGQEAELACMRQVQAAWRSWAVADAAGGRRRRPHHVDHRVRAGPGHRLPVHVDHRVRAGPGHRLPVHGARSQSARRRTVQQRRRRHNHRCDH